MRNNVCQDFIIIGPNYYNYAYSTVRTIKNMGYSVSFFEEKEFYNHCYYLQRKFYKFGLQFIKDKWDKRWNDDLLTFIRKNADVNTVLLFLAGGELISTNTLLELSKYRKILMLWDSIRRFSIGAQKQIGLYDKVYVFEYDDISYIKDTFDMNNISYLPLGYDENIYFARQEERRIDMAFVGAVTPDRFRILEHVAKYAITHHLHLVVVGKWFNDKWPWMVWKFKRKHPELYSCLINHNVPPEETAHIYRHSKIVLNINNSVHKSISPRTFEILATRTFQLMNKGQESNGTLNLDSDLVMFENDADLLQKIRYFISNEKERIRIMEKGYMDVQKFSLSNLLQRVVHEL